LFRIQPSNGEKPNRIESDHPWRAPNSASWG
jgi:hypothetical protein